MALGGLIGVSLFKFIIGPFWEKASEWADGYVEKQKTIDIARAEMEITKAKLEAELHQRRVLAEIAWETRALEGQERSWKDEYILILWSIPLMAIFVPGLQDYVKEGFKNLEQTPTWYVQGWGVIVASVYGIKKFVDMVDRYTVSRHEQSMAKLDDRKAATPEMVTQKAPEVSAPKVVDSISSKKRPHQQEPHGG